MKTKKIIGIICICLALVYALFNSKISAAVIGLNTSTPIVGIFFLGVFIGGLYMMISSKKD